MVRIRAYPMLKLCDLPKTSAVPGESAMIAEAWHRRHAIQIAAALPDNVQDALLVLRLAHELVEQFLGEGGQFRSVPRESAAVIPLSSAMSGANRLSVAAESEPSSPSIR